MALYETLFIAHPDHGGRVKDYIESYKRLIERVGGTFDQVDEWGLRDLAYPIEKQSKGFYSLLRYRATARTVEELERTMKFSEGILRYLTVRLEDSAVDAPRRATEEAGSKAKSGTDESSEKAGPQS